MEPLTGKDAVAAVRLFARLGESGASFDRHRVDAAVRTSLGRFRLRIALRRLRVFVPRPALAVTRGSRPRARVRAVRGRAAPSRPSSPPPAGETL